MTLLELQRALGAIRMQVMDPLKDIKVLDEAGFIHEVVEVVWHPAKERYYLKVKFNPHEDEQI